MSPERFRRLEELYHAARQGTPEERATLLAQTDSELRRELELLLAQPSRGEFLDRPAIQNAPDLLEDSTIAHLAGQTISHYRILEVLGAGGMGVVYKAFDTKLNRYVALKFLPPHLRRNEGVKRRLEQEARAASAMDHPNIVVIHDIDETADGDLFIAMAFHEGATLRDRIVAAPGGLPVAEALQIARQIATGLAKAHQRGILHRDIKPGNVIVAKDGIVRIIDFGLAKSSDTAAAAEDSPHGTPLYMSPEQASGKPVDRRTDLWSLGAVLYEMLAGKPAFRGESQHQVTHAVLHEEPPTLREERPGLPVAVEDIVARALQKDPARRYQTAEEMVRDLSMVLAGLDRTGSARRRALWGLAALGAVTAVALLAWRFSAKRTPVTSAAEYVQLTNFSDSATAPALSPDGRMVAFFRGGAYFLGGGQVYVKVLPDGESRQLTNDPAPKYDPVFTPDGSGVAYTEVYTPSDSWETWTAPVRGGPPSRLMGNAAGLSWIGPDRVLFSRIRSGLHMGIVTAKQDGSDERAIYFPQHERAMAHYSWLSPDWTSVAIVEMDASEAWMRCRVAPMDGKSAGIQVGPEGACTAAAWSQDGRWLYLNVNVGGRSHLWRQRWRNRAPDGEPEQITFGPTDEEGLAVAPDGKSVITSVGVRESSVWMHDLTGDRMISQEGSASHPAVTADGKRLYYLLQKDARSDVQELWLRDLGSGASKPLLQGLRIVDYAMSPDEAQVAFTAAGRRGELDVYVAAVDRAAVPRLVVRGGDRVSFCPGGRLIFRQLSGQANYLARIQVDGTGLARIQGQPIADKFGVSPDGRWVLAAGRYAGLHGTYALSVDGNARRQICTTRCDAKWSADGKYVYTTVGPPTRSNGRTYILPVASGTGLPDLPPIDIEGPSGQRSIPRMETAPGPNPETYAFATSTFQGNLFRIPLH